MESSIEVVEFTLADGRYAIDVHLIREIVEMVAITPIPRAPPYITGVINLRGEIINIVNLNKHLALPPKELSKSQKIIVFMADTIKGNNVGIVVDSVASVAVIPDSQVKLASKENTEKQGNYLKGIITISSADETTHEPCLVIWLDILKLFKDIEKK
jgi:purine-binding chemotaxis protein CheW